MKGMAEAPRFCFEFIYYFKRNKLAPIRKAGGSPPVQELGVEVVGFLCVRANPPEHGYNTTARGVSYIDSLGWVLLNEIIPGAMGRDACGLSEHARSKNAICRLGWRVYIEPVAVIAQLYIISG